MNSKPPVLILLRSPETIRRQYHDGITRAFPDLKVTLVDNVAKAELSHLADAEIIITHGPHLEERAGFVLGNAPKLRWVQGIGTGVDNIADRRELRDEVMVTCIQGVHGAPMSEAAMCAMLALSRKLPRSMANKAAHKWENWPSRTLDGKTVGILGVGLIAEAMATVAPERRDALVERLAQECPTVSWGWTPPIAEEPWFPVAQKLRFALDYVRYLAPRYADVEKLRLRNIDRTPRVVRWLTSGPGAWLVGPRRVQAALTRLERVHSADRIGAEALDFVRAIRPSDPVREIVDLPALLRALHPEPDTHRAHSVLATLGLIQFLRQFPGFQV